MYSSRDYSNELHTFRIHNFNCIVFRITSVFHTCVWHWQQGKFYEIFKSLLRWFEEDDCWTKTQICCLSVLNNIPSSGFQQFWEGTNPKAAVSQQWVAIFRMSSVPSTRPSRGIKVIKLAHKRFNCTNQLLAYFFE